MREPSPGVGRQITAEKTALRARRRKVPVNRDLGKQRPEHLKDALAQQEHHRDRHQPAIRTHVSQQAAHQKGVVGFTEDLFFHWYSV